MDKIPVRFPIATKLDTDTRDEWPRVIASEGFSTDSEDPQLIWMLDRNSFWGGHDGAVAVGQVTEWKIDGKNVEAEGFILNDAAGIGLRSAELIQNGLITGASIDLADVDFKEELFEEDGVEKLRTTFTQSRAAGMTVVSSPAMVGASVELAEALVASCDECDFELDEGHEALIASASGLEGFRIHSKYTPPQPVTFDAALFENPQLKRAGGPTYDSRTGRVWGHLALWKSCHEGSKGSCVPPPRSQTGYAQFHRQPVMTSKGPLNIGLLVQVAAHAKVRGINAEQAIAHYADNGRVWAYVRAGEDEHGIWFSGVAAPGTSPEDLTRALACQISGDWRPYAGFPGRELVMGLAVPLPAFPVLAEGGQDDKAALIISNAPQGKLDNWTLMESKVNKLIEHFEKLEAAQEEAARQRAKAARSARLAALRDRTSV